MGVKMALTWLGLVVGAVALVTQFVISMRAYAAMGTDVPGSLGMFFGYYTILTNIALVLIYLSDLVKWRWLEVFRKLDVTGMMVANMLLVMLFVHFFLRGLVTLSGLALVCDYALHYATPIIFFIWWVVTVRHGPLLMRRIPIMLVPTFAYFLYTMARGAWTKLYPYPVLDVTKLGYQQVLLNAVYLTAGLGALMLIVVAIDELLGKRKS